MNVSMAMTSKSQKSVARVMIVLGSTVKEFLVDEGTDPGMDEK